VKWIRRKKGGQELTHRERETLTNAMILAGRKFGISVANKSVSQSSAEVISSTD
jgi:hypothetical protein